MQRQNLTRDALGRPFVGLQRSGGRPTTLMSLSLRSSLAEGQLVVVDSQLACFVKLLALADGRMVVAVVSVLAAAEDLKSRNRVLVAVLLGFTLFSSAGRWGA